MSKVRICDICGEPLIFKHYKVKMIYDVTDKRKLDICFTCWRHMKDYIKLKEKENGREHIHI